jgi:hypothetical protein
MRLQCWKCGEPLKDIILPFSRFEECTVCKADQHVCMLCKEYDKTLANACREDRADFVLEKDKANFCDYFKPRPHAYQRLDDAAALAAKAKLDALFGMETNQDKLPGGEGSAQMTEAERAIAELKRLFGDK